MNMPTTVIMNKRTLYYQKVVILPLFVTTIFPYHFILPWFSLANLVQPTRPSSIALLLAGYFLSSLPPIKIGVFRRNDHRFLLKEKFKVMIAFIEQLDINYQNGFAPWRTLPLRPCVSSKLYYPSSTEYSPEKLCSYDKQIDYTTVGGAVQAISALFTGRQEVECPQHQYH